ncbi:homologous-pairing protein 2 homolog [Diachasma alloeum]|uniref:Homologous-pairing protein 2 n=1 Tax=Diachasma alloeum TaxID=454923 RepID=A0A4E0RLN9_9HYME|nr:homologous-pairing protein 2 homolog [Diachasma alloeum]XP_015113617.1 homologous-pairing protein 2 homolog [Diachasma alloeum]THK33049.1 homologous-pairing protein 2 [Diachasma alloeum]
MATAEAVHNFLKTQNRPYNLNDIVSNLPNEKSKATIQQALEELKKEGKVFEKTYGKQKIYCVTQATKHNAAELKRMSGDLQAHAAELEMRRKALEHEVKIREEKLEALKSGPTLEEAIRESDAVKLRVTALETKLDHLVERSSSQPNLGEKKKKAEVLRDQYSREYLKRKRIGSEIVDSILEGFPGTKKQLFEEVGIEERIVKIVK